MIDLTITGKIPRGVTRADLDRAIHLTFARARRAPTGSVSLAFISDDEMLALNRRWRGKRKTTDVLSFAPADGISPPGSPKQWGDLFVSPTYVRHESETRGILFKEELLRVTIHGMLHLFGFDHAELAEEKRMFGLQERVLEAVQSL